MLVTDNSPQQINAALLRLKQGNTTINVNGSSSSSTIKIPDHALLEIIQNGTSKGTYDPLSSSPVTITVDNTTYTLSLSNNILSITDNSGTSQSVTISTENTTYTLSLANKVISLTDNDGNVQSITLPSEIDDSNVSTDTTYSSSKIKTDIIDLIPTQASSSNQLADKDFVNSSISTATSTFQGSYANWTSVPSVSSEYKDPPPKKNDYIVVMDCSGYELALTKAYSFTSYYTITKNNGITWVYSLTSANHYSYVGTGSINNDVLTYDGNTYNYAEELSGTNYFNLHGTCRFKYSQTTWTSKDDWSFEYIVNDTPLTEAQLKAINSGITAAILTQIQTDISNKQNKVITLTKAQYDALTPAQKTGNIYEITDVDLQLAEKVVCPVGTILPFASDNIPAGYLLCDGSAVSRVNYNDLFNVIGTTYGSGDGSTTFNLPNLVGKFPEGANNNLGTSKTSALPNIGGYFDTYMYQNGNGNGGFQTSVITANCAQAGSTADYNHGRVEFYGSSSSSVYKDGQTTVQPPALCINYIIKAVKGLDEESTATVANSAYNDQEGNNIKDTYAKISNTRLKRSFSSRITIASNTTITSSTPITYTALNDGLLYWNIIKTTAAYSAFISINDVQAAVGSGYFAPNCFSGTLEVNKGDVIKAWVSGDTFSVNDLGISYFSYS